MFPGKKAEQEIVHETFLKIVIGIGLLIASLMLLFSLLDLFIEKPDFATKYGFERLALAIDEAPLEKEVFLPLFINGDAYHIVTNDLNPECRRKCLCLCSLRKNEACAIVQKKCFDDPLKDVSASKSRLSSSLGEEDYYTDVETIPGGQRITYYAASPVFTVRIFKEKNQILLQSFTQVTSSTEEILTPGGKTAAELSSYCTESDTKIKGKNLVDISNQIYVFGEIKGYEKEANTIILEKDVCKDETTLFEYTCNFKDPLYSKDGIIQKEEHTCMDGCKDGACILPQGVALQSLTYS